MNRSLLNRSMPPLLAAVLLLCAGCAKKGGAPGFVMPPRAVTAATVAQEDVPVYLDEIGTCVSTNVAAIVPQVTGKITEVLFTEGTDVKKGDPLFTIDPRPYEAALAQAEATLVQDQAKLRLSADQYKRSQQLASGNFISQQDLDTLQTSVSTGDALLKADEAAVVNAQLNVEYCHIVAPIDGRLGKRLVDIGNVVAANSTASMVVIEQVDPLYVDFTVAEPDLPEVRQHFAAGPLKVGVSLPDQPEVTREGTLSLIDNTVASATGTVQLRATLPNADRTFWPGQFVNVRLVLQTLKGALLVPTQALQLSQQGPFVFVVKDNSTADLRPIKPGQRQGDLTVVTEGLAAGEKVVVTGQLFLAPGGKVAVVDPAAASASGAAPAAAKDSSKP